MRRMFFAAYQGYRERRALRMVIRDLALQSNNICQLTPEWLLSKNIQTLILDFDGVLAPHGTIEPIPEIQGWLSHFLEQWPAERLWIFSNAPTEKRKAFFAKQFPGVRWVNLVQKKPYPQALRQWLVSQQIPKEQVLLVDDRLLTGVLCAVLCGVSPLWITQPIMDFKRNFFEEAYIQLFRQIERCWFTYF